VEKEPLKYQRLREEMVRQQVEARGIADPAVLAALRKVPRHIFVSEALRDQAYGDFPLPIGEQQTISQPYIVAEMSQALQLSREDRVLEIGTGSGYQAAILAAIACRVWSIERHAVLARRARRHLRDLGIENAYVLHGDGRHGYAAAAPFDAIVVAAAAAEPPPVLLEQLAPGGRLVIPVGPPDVQDLVVYERAGTGVRERVLCACCFVPLLSGLLTEHA